VRRIIVGMYTRLWTTGYDVARKDELDAFADQVSGPMFDQLPGCLGYIHASTDERWITQTFWESESDIRLAEESSVYQDVVARILDAGFLRGAQTTDVLEVTSYAPPLD